jgi:hypothetical protein
VAAAAADGGLVVVEMEANPVAGASAASAVAVAAAVAVVFLFLYNKHIMVTNTQNRARQSVPHSLSAERIS